MNRRERALYAKWISKFGAKKVRELSKELDAGTTIAERSEALVESSSKEELASLILDGFDGFFHQTVYLRKLKKADDTIKAIKEISKAKPVEKVVLEDREDASASEARCLLMVTETLEFLQTTGPSLIEDMPFPVAVDVNDTLLAVRVLTMQITVKTWGRMLEKDLRRLLTPVHADELYDRSLNFLRHHKVEVGEYIDFSEGAIGLMKRKCADTLSGAYEVGTAGSTRHNTLRGRGHKALREAMPDRFEELVSSERIVHSEVQLAGNCLGLIKGAKVVLYPTTGKMAFRSKLQGNDPDEFIKEMAG